MKPRELANLIRNAACRVLGAEDAGNDAQREVLAALIRGCDQPDSTILCEPSLARNTARPPDVVLVDLVAGLHVIEVKGVTLDQIEALEPGGQFRIRYQTVAAGKNPFAQVRNAMFDIKDAVERAYTGQWIVPLKYWIVLAAIQREGWFDKWGRDAFCPPELLFADDLPRLAERLRGAGQAALDRHELRHWPTDQIQVIWQAFGDSSVLFPRPDERPRRRTRECTLGELFDEAAESYKALSDEQQKLSVQTWMRGPRLVRGVAGSGKTIVLANNLARRLQRSLPRQPQLFGQSPPRLGAVCFNRTLVPFIRKKIEIAYRQRTGQPIPAGLVEVISYNRLMWSLAQQGLWRYQPYEASDDRSRVAQYLKDLDYVKEHDRGTFERCAFDALYVDEGQDFLEEDFRLLKELCRVPPGGEPSLFVFYDDAQNLYGRPRPNWHSLGVNVVGRSHVMSECFRNTRQIVQAAFNVLYGSFAADGSQLPTRSFGDIATLQEKELLRQERGVWRVRFARREGLPPRCTVVPGRQRQAAAIIDRLRWLIEDQQVRPEDIHVLAYYRNQLETLEQAISAARLPSVEGIHLATLRKDALLHQRGWLSLSTVASAKGYDAYCVLLAGADEFPIDVQGRASFYVACTRAIEYLEVFASRSAGLVAELEQSITDQALQQAGGETAA